MAIETEEQFIAVVQKAESDAERNLQAYKIRLALFAALGYVVIFTVLILLLGLVGGMVAIALFSSSILLLLIKKKIIFVVLIAIWTFVKALWIKFDKPQGFQLKRADYPELFKEIDTLTDALNALKIHQVILNEDFNAAVTQSPKYGVLGGQQNTLFLGLELLLALSPQEMRSVLAHEFGHLSGNHSRFSGWIYRVRASWDRVMHAFGDNDSYGARLMRRFFNWYAPYFSAYSFALARNNEYEADAVSAELMSSSVAVQALINVHALSPHIDEKYWTSYFESASEIPEPTLAPYQGLSEFLHQSPISREELSERFKQALEVETHYADTHPSLNDRINALGAEAILPEPILSNAAQLFLGDKYQEVLTHFDTLWMDENKEKWNDRYQYVSNARQALKDYSDSNIADLDDNALWDFATWTGEFETEEAALPLYRAFLSRNTDSVGASYHIGRLLIAKEDEEALGHLRVAFNSPEAIGDAANWGYHYLKDRDRDDEADRWLEDARAADSVHQEAADERNSAMLGDTYFPPKIDDELLNKIQDDLAELKNVKSAWLAQKTVRHYPDQPVYIVAFKPKGFYRSDESVMKTIAAAIQTENDIFIVSTRGETRKLAKKVQKCGSKIL